MWSEIIYHEMKWSKTTAFFEEIYEVIGNWLFFGSVCEIYWLVVTLFRLWPCYAMLTLIRALSWLWDTVVGLILLSQIVSDSLFTSLSKQLLHLQHTYITARPGHRFVKDLSETNELIPHVSHCVFIVCHFNLLSRSWDLGCDFVPDLLLLLCGKWLILL